jgi:F0F1-type ATP synthase membrane subunit c/vacuolar-type H+-ATPase subunit K
MFIGHLGAGFAAKKAAASGFTSVRRQRRIASAASHSAALLHF